VGEESTSENALSFIGRSSESTGERWWSERSGKVTWRRKERDLREGSQNERFQRIGVI